MQNTYLTVTSIDIGSAHFAVYSERVARAEFDAWKSLPAHPRDDAPGQCLWRVVWNLRSRVLGAVADAADSTSPHVYGVDLTFPAPRGHVQDLEEKEREGEKKEDEDGSQIPWTHRHLLWNLRRHHYMWAGSDQILIEKQLNCNPRAIRLETVCTTYFAMFCPRGVQVHSYPARYKTHLLGGPVGRKFKSARKTWAKNWALGLCERRNDMILASWFKLPRVKKDDLADAMLMVQAWKLQQRLRPGHPAHWSRVGASHYVRADADEPESESETETERETESAMHVQ